MTDRDDELARALRDYYQRSAQQPAPDVTGKVMMSASRHTTSARRWTAIGGGVLAAAAAGAVVAVALVNHDQSSTGAPSHSSTPAPSAVPTPTATVPTATARPVVAAGLPVHGFVPTDVSAISADEWWVLGYNGPSCTSASCTRILHTTDRGNTFTSVATPPVAPAQGGDQPHVGMRFADALNGWVYNATASLWATHDGGATWAVHRMTGSVTSLEASAGLVDAVVCNGGPDCTLQRSPASRDAWSVLPIPPGMGALSHLNVNGADIWVVPGGIGGTSLLESRDGGQHFSTASVCAGDLQVISVNAVDANVLWATCATGTQAVALRSVDGGQHFTRLPGQISLPNFATIAGVSPSTAVIAGLGLQRTVDGGQTFTTVKGDQLQATIVGFTTPVNGFEFTFQGAAPRRTFLYRTEDAGAHWLQVLFPG